MADPVDVDTGEPIAELADIGEEPAPGFVRRLWGRIDRRRLGGELTDLTWHGILAVCVEYLGMIFDLFKVEASPAVPPGKTKESSDE